MYCSIEKNCIHVYTCMTGGDPPHLKVALN